MNKPSDEWIKTHIVTGDDATDSTSPIYKVLRDMDVIRDVLLSVIKEVAEYQKGAMCTAQNNDEQLTVQQWVEKYVHPVEDILFHMDERVENAIYQEDEQ